MDHTKNFKKGRRITKILLEIVGFNVIDEGYRPDWRTFICICIAIWGNFSVFHTIYTYRRNFVLCLKAFSAGPEAFQGACQIVSILKHGKTFKSLINGVEHIFQVNSRKIGVYRQQAIRNCSNHYKFCLIFGNAVLFCVMFIAIIMPLYSYLVQGKQEFFYDVYIPGYPPRDQTSIIVTYIVQVVQMSVAFLGNASFDFLLFTLVIHLSLLIGLFAASMKEFDDMINDENITDYELRMKLRNSVIMHQDLIRYISIINKSMRLPFIGIVAANAFGIPMNLFCMLKTDWMGCYGFCLFAVVKMFMVCALGTYVDYQSDMLLDAIYHLKWYKLPRDCQRTIFLLLLRSQSFTKLTVVDVTPLNVATGAKIMKTIYSYLMVLLSFEE